MSKLFSFILLSVLIFAAMFQTSPVFARKSSSEQLITCPQGYKCVKDDVKNDIEEKPINDIPSCKTYLNEPSENYQCYVSEFANAPTRDLNCSNTPSASGFANNQEIRIKAICKVFNNFEKFFYRNPFGIMLLIIFNFLILIMFVVLFFTIFGTIYLLASFIFHRVFNQ